MSVLRKNGFGSVLNTSGREITVKCPKCQEDFIVSENRGNKPVRCTKCAYPLIRRSDLLLIVEACQNLTRETQVRSAVRILGELSDILPEAGTALGVLANKYTLPLNDEERWNRLNSAYAGGDEKARQWLDRMCQSNPGAYRQDFCEGCGAPRYYVKHLEGKALCTYCQSTD